MSKCKIHVDLFLFLSAAASLRVLEEVKLHGVSSTLTHFSLNMDALSSSLSTSSDPKAAIMRQVQQEAAINNARQLISVNLLRPLIHEAQKKPSDLIILDFFFRK